MKQDNSAPPQWPTDSQIAPPATTVPGPSPSPEFSELFAALNDYDSLFEDVPAASDQQLAEAFHLRYSVYCLERQFEDAARHPQQKERDAYDDHALHSLLIDKQSQQPIGTVRLVRPAAAHPTPHFPLAAYAPPEALREIDRLPVGSTAEVSRFAIARTRRHHAAFPCSDIRSAVSGGDAERRRALLPHLSLGLIRGLVRLSLQHGITHWCLAAEPSLLRRLNSYGLHFHEAGPLVDHRGLRRICHADLETLLRHARMERPQYWSVITQGGRLCPAAAYGEAA